VGAVLLVVVLALCAPLFDDSTALQLVINTGTTIITFLMVFLIQSTQNRDSKNINIKLDELLRAMQGARTGLANLDTLSDGDVSKIEQELIRAGQREGVTKLVTPEAVRPANTDGGRP
jgi:low affinity Fe/Cu permease